MWTSNLSLLQAADCWAVPTPSPLGTRNKIIIGCHCVWNRQNAVCWAMTWSESHSVIYMYIGVHKISTLSLYKLMYLSRLSSWRSSSCFSRLFDYKIFYWLSINLKKKLMKAFMVDLQKYVNHTNFPHSMLQSEWSLFTPSLLAEKRVTAPNNLIGHKCVWPHAVGGAMTPFRKSFMNVNVCT